MKAHVICYPAPPPEVVVTMTVEDAQALVVAYPSLYSNILATLLDTLNTALQAAGR